MRKLFPYSIELPHGIYDVEGIAVAEGGRLIEFQTYDKNWHEPFRVEKPRYPSDHILHLIQQAIEEKHADDIDETREPERADTAPVYV